LSKTISAREHPKFQQKLQAAREHKSSSADILGKLSAGIGLMSISCLAVSAVTMTLINEQNVKQSAFLSCIIWGISLLHSFSGCGASKSHNLESIASRRRNGMFCMLAIAFFSYGKLNKDLA
jgi:hypothetical protein